MYKTNYLGGSLMAAGLAGIIMAAPGAAPAAPPEMLPGTYATAVVGDFPGMLDRVADLGKKINPGVSAQVLRGQIGMFLRDDGMSSIPAGAGMMIAMPHQGSPYFLLETAPGKASHVADAFKRRGKHAVTTAGDNLVIAAKDQAALDTVLDGETSAAAEMLRQSDDKFLVLTLDADKLTNDKGDELRRAFDRKAEKALTKRPEHYTSATATFTKLLANYMVAVGKRTDVATVKLDISGEGVMFDRSVYPVGGVKTSERQGPSGQDLRKGLAQPDRVVAAFDYHMDMQTALKMIQPIVKDTISGVGLAEADVAEITNLFNTAAQGYGDAGTGWLGGGGEGDAQGAIVLSLENADAAINQVKVEMESLASGAISRYYALLDLDTSATLTENAGEVSGSPYHAFALDYKPSNDRTSKWLDRWMKIESGKVMVQGEKMLLTLGDVSLEDLANAASGGNAAASELKSRSALDDGGFLYMDFYPAGLADCVSKPRIKEALESYGDSAVSSAMYVDGERIRANCFVPADIIQKTAEGVQAMKAAKKAKNDE